MRALILLALLLGPTAVGSSQEPATEPESETLTPEKGRLPDPDRSKPSPMKLLREIRENMAEIERLLEKRETGSPTQSSQNRAIERLDELIEMLSVGGC